MGAELCKRNSTCVDEEVWAEALGNLFPKRADYSRSLGLERRGKAYVFLIAYFLCSPFPSWLLSNSFDILGSYLSGRLRTVICKMKIAHPVSSTDYENKVEMVSESSGS